MTNNFIEYGRVTFRGKRVLVGVEKDKDGNEINQAYFLGKDDELIKINRKTKEGQILTRVFFLGLDSIDYEKAKEEYDKIILEPKERFENINIETYMPNVNEEQYDAIYELLKRLQETFPYVSAENLKLRLPNLTVEDTSSKDILIDAFYRPKSNYFGMVKDNLHTSRGKALAIHELSHMISARAELNEKGKIKYSENVGFCDSYHNAIAITEGFNEMFASLARCAEPRSYETEVGLATLLYVISDNCIELTKRFYEGNRYYTSTFGRNAEEAKRFVKNLDYNNQIYYYNASKFTKAVKETEKTILQKYEVIKTVNGRTTKLTDEEKVYVHQMIIETFNKEYKDDFTDSNFLPNAQNILLDLYSDFMHKSENEITKDIATDAVLTSFLFTFNMSDKAKKFIDEKEIEKNDVKFFKIESSLGLSPEEIATLIVSNKDEAILTSSEDTLFDDDRLKQASDQIKENYNRRRQEKENKEDIIEEKIDSNIDEENDDLDA